MNSDLIELFLLLVLATILGFICVFIVIRFFLLKAIDLKVQYFARLEKEKRVVIPWTTHTAMYAVLTIVSGLLVGKIIN